MNKTIESLLPLKTVRALRNCAEETDFKNSIYDNLLLDDIDIEFYQMVSDSESHCIIANVCLTSRSLRCYTKIFLSELAACHPNDKFNEYFGRKLALKRALAPLPKKLRKHVWDYYLSQNTGVHLHINQE